MTTQLGCATLRVLLLRLTTFLRRLIVPVIVFLVWAPVAQAWSWPIQGPVKRPFAYDQAHPYASGQHRGIDIGANTVGETVVAPAAGTVSFAGTVPSSGKSVTIETADGYSVTLTHLGSIVVATGVAVAEGDQVGTIGPSGTPELDGPYLHLGIRHTPDPDGYVDPLSLLPPVAGTGGSDSGAPATQPVASGSSSASSPPASAPAPTPTTGTPVVPSQEPAVQASSARARQHERGRAQASRAEAQSQRSSRRPPVSHPATIGRRAPQRPRQLHHRVSEPMIASRRPVGEAVAPHEPADLGAGHELRPPRAHVAEFEPEARRGSSALLGLVCNGAGALVAVAAAFVAARHRRHDLACRIPVARVLHLPSRILDHDVRRAA